MGLSSVLKILSAVQSQPVFPPSCLYRELVLSSYCNYRSMVSMSISWEPCLCLCFVFFPFFFLCLCSPLWRLCLCCCCCCWEGLLMESSLNTSTKQSRFKALQLVATVVLWRPCMIKMCPPVQKFKWGLSTVCHGQCYYTLWGPEKRGNHTLHTNLPISDIQPS